MFEAMTMPEIPDDAFTTEEIQIETNRLRRRHYYTALAKTVFYSAISIMGVHHTYMIITERSLVYPTIAEASRIMPLAVFTPELMYQSMLWGMAFMGVYGAVKGMLAWWRRVPDDGDYVYDAVVSLTEQAREADQGGGCE